MAHRKNQTYLVTGKFDMEHLLSRDQVEIAKELTQPGDIISFENGEKEIQGVIDKKYDHIFTLKNGKSVRWVDYVIGCPYILDYLKRNHPIEHVEYDPFNNLYVYKGMRVD